MVEEVAFDLDLGSGHTAYCCVVCCLCALCLCGCRIVSYRITVMHHSSTSTDTPNFIEIEETFLRTGGRTDVQTGVRHLRPTLLGELGGVDLKMQASITLI